MKIGSLTLPLPLRDPERSRRERARRRASLRPKTASFARFPILALVTDGPFAETKG